MEILTQGNIIKREYIRFSLGGVKNEEGQARAALTQATIFSPFILSIYGMLGKYARVVITTLSQLMNAKIEESISHVKGLVNGWVAIVVGRSCSRIICGDRVSSTFRNQELDWKLV